MRSSVIAAVLVCLSSATAAFAQSVLENESEIVFREGEAVIRLAVEGTAAIRNASTRIELLDTSDTVRVSGGGRRDIAAGTQMLEFRLPLDGFTRRQNEDLAWYRMRYSVADTSGIISVSQIARELFELRIIAASNIMSGMGYRVRVRAVNPFTETPAAGVELETTVEIDVPGDTDETVEYKKTGITDAEGFAVMDFAIPAEAVLGREGEVRVVGTRNGIVREAEDDLTSLQDDIQFVMMTDKPIYQPEQTLNVRGIVFKGGESKTILADAAVEFRIEDEDDTLLYREKIQTSGFGVAAISWRIPSNAKLGDYSIRVLDTRGEIISFNRVKVSRYNLPNFVVNAKPSKPYYLPTDKQAEIEVRGDYLFGKPVTKGKVRVVEETSREWNYKEQKYNIDEGEVREGELDPDGKFIGNFDLAKAHEELEEDNWRKHRDIRFAAYLTDATTNKTEQRRFDVRVSREPIHVYFIDAENDHHPGLPVTAYISTFYADGTPAQCDVEIKASEDEGEKFRTVTRIRTNSFGAGKLTIMRPKIGGSDDDLDLLIIAKDKNGQRGTLKEKELSFDPDEHLLQIATDRTIYKPGETVTVLLRSTVNSGTVYVDVVNGWTVIGSYFARLNNGTAELTIPYQDAFKGALTVVAFVEDPEDDDELVKASRGIIYPAQQNIGVTAEFERAVYKPNEDASVRFSVVDAVGQAIESALGIVILDKAVEERARTDAEFGTMFRDLGSWLGYGKSFGGVNVKDLNDLNLTKPISPEMQLVAEVILHDSYYYPNLFHSNRYFDQAKSVFGYSIQKQLEPMAKALADAYKKRNFLHPTDEAGLLRIASLYNVDFSGLRDPWGVAYKPEFWTNKNLNYVTINSAGPDKQFDTRDDFVAYSTSFEYFTPMGKAIDTAVKNYNLRTGGFIRDQQTLFRELGIRELNDRFGRPYRITFDGDGRWLQTRIRSAGKDGKFEEYEWRGDDFQVWQNLQNYFAPVEKLISDSQRDVKNIPMIEAEFRSQLNAAGISEEMLKDGNGRPLYINAVQTSRYWDKVTIETVQVYGENTRTENRIVTPVTQEIMQFTIRGPGKDGKQGTHDDVTFMQLIHVLAEQAKDDPTPGPVNKPIKFTPNTGSITGMVTDVSGAVVPGAQVTAIGSDNGVEGSTTTNSGGRFLIGGLPVGTYSVRSEANGFKVAVMQGVAVNTNFTTEINLILEAGDIAATVEVTVSSESIANSTNATIEGSQVADLPLVNGQRARSLLVLQPGIKVVTKSGERETPRIREYFPETLLWQPEVVTDADGRAEVKFRMADNITTWKMYTIASTKNGKVGFAEKEVTAFQSFFVDLDPPKFLTEGDEIFLPTQVRNYTDKKQKVDVTMSPADWFAFIDSDKKQVDVLSGQGENAVFGFRATKPIKDGKQRVMAMAETDSDAIERPVTVRPDGHEIVATESRYFTGSTWIDVNFPANALPRTQKAEMKIYPNLMAHVAESVEGLLRRPYGCGEQTISSTYPNVMILKFAGGISTETERLARKYLQDGYDRLLGYQVSDGGFSYWGGKDEADLALTGYALRFLADASAFIAVDTNVIEKAENWLVTQQRADGSWNRKYRWETTENEARAKSLTTYIARTLAMLKKEAEPGATAVGKHEEALTKALSYLHLRNSQIDDPYSLALLGLALHDAGDSEMASVIAKKLATLGRDEAGGMYWNLESNTVFNGWGIAGRIETTALVAQILMKLHRGDADTENGISYEPMIAKAMLFLLKNKDRYGVWYSTQTTVNVLDAFVASLSANSGETVQNVDVILNGETVRTVEIAPDKLDLIVVDLGQRLSPVANTVELRASNGSPLMAQVVSNHYIGWRDANSSARQVNQSRAVVVGYDCDRTEATIMQEISCTVSAERVGFRGYGMLLAEIGIPPGADISRESLQAAMENDWSLSKYEVLPDRIIVYMWAKAGGTKFNFKFRPRYGINAQTPASVVYDYYNPEAQAVSPPLRFIVK